VHLDHVEADVEILATAPGADQFFEVPVRRRDDPEVAALQPGVSEGCVWVLLDQKQDLHLQEQREIADLIEDERSALGGCDQSPRSRSMR
jgi:hypothetical protein